MTQSTTCARCGEYKHTPIRDAEDGYICAGCLEAERDQLRAENAEQAKVIERLRGQIKSALECFSETQPTNFRRACAMASALTGDDYSWMKDEDQVVRDQLERARTIIEDLAKEDK